MSDQLKKNYDAAFYANQKSGSRKSAEIVLAALQPVLGAVGSALDVGCGAGGWLWAVREAFPNADVFGVDHPDVPRSQMLIDAQDFSGCDLSQPINLARRFDLVISLEVAEHIDPARADVFVENLTRHGERVLFSAATPRQGGTGHVNEQWPDYWAEKFKARGLQRFDIVRPLIWDEDEVASWYKQNMMLFASPDARLSCDSLEDWRGRAVIHPGLWMRKTEPLKAQIARAIKRRKPAHEWR